jgi:hypothetical protein
MSTTTEEVDGVSWPVEDPGVDTLIGLFDK